MTVSPTVRSHPEAQGFCRLDDKVLEELAPSMRWTYTLDMLATIIGVTLTSPAVLWSLVANNTAISRRKERPAEGRV
jgi:hypothetical protein